MIPDTLRNQFLVMRHGLSLANDQSLIISSPGRGIDRYGLTAAGIEQVIEAVGANRDRLAATQLQSRAVPALGHIDQQPLPGL